MLKDKKRLIYFIFTIMMMIIIFVFSSQSSEKSNSLSYTISYKIYQKIENKVQTNIELEENKNNDNTNKNNNNFPIKNRIFRKINVIIRKTAHIFLYLLLGIFMLLYINTYKISFKKAIMITILFCFTYACLDEFNQYLRGTRTALFMESLIDTFGCMLGCLLIGLVKKTNRKKKINKII